MSHIVIIMLLSQVLKSKRPFCSLLTAYVLSALEIGYFDAMQYADSKLPSLLFFLSSLKVKEEQRDCK